VRLCVLGNSHAGALKLAWERMTKSYSDIEITFFATGGHGLSRLKVEGGKLLPLTENLKNILEYTSGGQSFLDPSDYDIFLIYGLYAKEFILNPCNSYSTAVLKSAAFDHTSTTLSYETLGKVREVTDKPIYVGHNPLPACLEENYQSSDLEFYHYGCMILNKYVYSCLDAQLIDQPLETIDCGMYTKLEFSKGSRRLSIGRASDDTKHPVGDSSHMNEFFGEIWLTEFFKRLSRLNRIEYEQNQRSEQAFP